MEPPSGDKRETKAKAMKEKHYFYDGAGNMIKVVEKASDDEGVPQADRETKADVVDFAARARARQTAEKDAEPTEGERRQAIG